MEPLQYAARNADQFLLPLMERLVIAHLDDARLVTKPPDGGVCTDVQDVCHLLRRVMPLPAYLVRRLGA